MSPKGKLERLYTGDVNVSETGKPCEKWTEILQSGLLRVLDLAKTSQSSDKVDAESEEASGQEHHDMGLLLQLYFEYIHDM